MLLTLTDVKLNLIFISSNIMNPLESYHIFICEKLFFNSTIESLSWGEKLVLLSLSHFWIKQCSKIKHTLWLLVQGLCRNLKQLKNRKKNETGHSFQRK